MATSGFASQELLFTIPEPRQITLTGGLTDLSEDVRLVTSNVMPLYRKTMRTVLAAAGIRVVANKKRFIIDIRVEDSGGLDLSDVPESARGEYYEIDLQDNAVIVRTASQLGALWGTHTLAGIYKAKARGLEIPNLRLRDWPDHAVRAVCLQSIWGFDRLTPEEWMVVFERHSSVKLNAIGIPLDGGRCPGRLGTFAEGLLAPFADHEAANREIHLSWYSPNLHTWKSDKYFPKFHATDPVNGDYLKQILNMARENGMVPYPVVSGLGGATALPALFPKIGAKGHGAGELQTFCFAEPDTRKLLGLYYGGLLSRFFPEEGAPLFMVDVALPDVKALCQCPKCKKSKPELLIQEHLTWLAELLVKANVGQVVFQDHLPADLSAAVFSAELLAALQKKKLASHVVLTVAAVAGGKGRKAPVAGWNQWSAPALERAVWLDGEAAGKSIREVVPAGFKAGMTGTLFETVWDSQAIELPANFANLAWRSSAPLPPWRAADTVASLLLGADAEVYHTAMEGLAAAILLESPLTPALRQSPFTHAIMPRNAAGGYDLAAFFAEADPKALRNHLQKLLPAAENAEAQLAALLDREGAKPWDVEMVRALLCEAHRLAAVGQALTQFLELYSGAGKKPDAKALAAAEAAKAALLAKLLAIENRRNKLTAPLRLAEFSPLFGLAETLEKSVREAVGTKQKSLELSWSWSFPTLA